MRNEQEMLTLITQTAIEDPRIRAAYLEGSRVNSKVPADMFQDYDVVYIAPLSSYTDQTAMLEGLYTKFNVDRPEDFRGHSLSVSDIVALKTDAVVSYHYVDSIGFKELYGFMPDNYQRNAEMGLEDDYGMIDGIINNGKKEEPPSVLEQLKAKPPERDRPAKPVREKEVERE